jgi:hypothetical protein
VEPETGDATRIDLGMGVVPNGDGILLQGKTLYVVQNFLNQIAVVELSSDLQRRNDRRTITNSLFRIPTTAARFGSTLCVVNSRFDTRLHPILNTMWRASLKVNESVPQAWPADTWFLFVKSPISAS